MRGLETGFLKAKRRSTTIKHVENSSNLIKLAFRYIIKSLLAEIIYIITFLSMQKAFGKHKVPEKEVYTDVLGTEREKIPTPPKSKSRT